MKGRFFVLLSAIILLFTACDTWMKDDDFYSEIENDVKVANATPVSVYVRYANSKMGTSTPSGFCTMKVDVPFELSAVTNDDYGFVRWVAFSTNDFPTSRQHSTLFYESAEKYAADFKALEIPSSEVSFSDASNVTTTVTLNTTRSDIFITPLVTKRPSVITSVPSNGRTDVVKNSQIRILFSKPIDESTLIDEFGNSNIQITSGRAVLTENTDDLSALDITNNFDFKLSKTKKMLTISAKKDEHNKTLYIFDGNSQISINIFEDVCDTDGYPMNGNYKFSFTTGTKEDSLAPKIEKLTAGIGEDCLSFEQYKYIIAGNNESEPNYTAEANAATNSLSAFTNGDIALAGVNKKPILKQRVKDKINIYVVATDIAGAGGNVNLGTDNQSESDVALVQVRACLYIDKEGNPVTTSAKAFANNSSGTDSSSVLSVKDFGYSMGMKDSSFSGKFEDATNNATTGTLFTYDLSSLDDGLIKIDIWAVDMVGNSGDSSQYIENYNNGYRSIFVVKDSTAPDSAAEMAKVITESGTDADGVVAPYEWYNCSTLNKLQVKDQTGSANLIHDANNEFLSSDDNKLKWIFKVGNDPSWSPSSTDDEWSLIHNENNQPLVRTLSGAVSSSDGPVDVTMCLMDDLGNISNPVLLSSIMYDNTAPVVPETSSWVKLNTSDSSYSYIVATTDSADLSDSGHVLNIPFTEEWAGLRRIKVTVQKDGTGEAVPQGSYTLHYVPQSGTARDITYTPYGSDSSLKVLSVNDTNPVKTGNLYISGIKIGDVNGGTYRVTVDLWDSSLNHSSTASEISIDKTEPEIKRVYIPGLKHSVEGTGTGVHTSTLDGWFLSREYVKGEQGTSSSSSVAPGYIPLYLFIDEKDSGIHKISFASTDDVTLFNSETKKTTLYKIENFGQADETRTLVPASDYVINTTDKTITLVDYPTVKLSSSSDNGFVLLVKDIGFSGVKTTENKINVTVEDLATLSDSENMISPFTTGSIQTSGIKVDSFLSNSTTGSTTHVPFFTLEDRAGTSAASDSWDALEGYSNEDIINVKVSLGDDSGSSAKSGYNRFKLSGATFIPGVTVVALGNFEVPYQLSADNTEITFRNKAGTDFAETDDYIVLRKVDFYFKNIQIDNASQGSNSISVTAYDLAGWDHAPETNSITLDTEAPVLSKGPYTANYTFSDRTYYNPAVNVYPHPNGENANGESVGGVPTFYTATTYKENAGVNSDGTMNFGSDNSGKASIILGIRATDNIGLSGTTDNSGATFIKYKASSTATKEEIVSGGEWISFDGVTAQTLASDSYENNGVKNSNFFVGFEHGSYSAVIIDKAGNASDVFHFNIVKDVDKPVVEWADSQNASQIHTLNESVLLETPAGSDIYMNNNTVSANSSELNYMAYSYTGSYEIKTIRYVTKKTGGDKYKIILNLGSSNYTKSASSETLIKMDGTEISGDTKADYAELSATSSSSPIEKYAISTWYGSWPNGSETKYTPVAPYGTVFPNGEKLVSEHTNSQGGEAEIACAYFGGNSLFRSYWRIQANCAQWYNWADTAVHTDKGPDSSTSYTADDVISYVKDNNLIIEIPQVSTAPISVFLRDGCGNMNFIVLGVVSGTGGEVAPSFVIDDRLGYQETDANGETVEPAVLQFPYNEYKPSATEYLINWGGKQFQFGDQSGNTTLAAHDGVGSRYGFMKDKVLHATYYNTAIGIENTDERPKLGLSIHYSNGNGMKKETATFNITQTQKASDDDITAKRYTARALLYCAQSSEKPSKQTILDCLTVERARAADEKTGQVTEWSYVQENNGAEEARLLIDYPCPDYKKLGWTVNKTDKTPEPYYIWYLFEDRVGNYEIAKVVNSKASGSNLISSTDTTIYDRWLYDGEGPVVAIRGTITESDPDGTSPEEISSSLDDVNKLIASNNGYIPYLEPDTTNGTYTDIVYIHSDDSGLRGTGLANSNTGDGTTHYTEEYSNHRIYENFADLEVSEITGIRAFAWSNSATPPSAGYADISGTGNNDGSAGWYSGYRATAVHADIGCDHSYGGNSGDRTNTYFSFTDTSSTYYGKYSGTKVNTVIPPSILSDSEAREVYLHVMDWTGNVRSYRMGQNLKFINDVSAPVQHYKVSGYDGSDGTAVNITKTEPGQYYVASENNFITVRIAGKGDKAENHEPIRLILPEEYFTDAGSGYKGFSFTKNSVQSVNGPYIDIPYSIYSQWDHGNDGTILNENYGNGVYFYDNVGNSDFWSFKCFFDETPPEIDTVSLVIQLKPSAQGNFYDAQNGIGTNAAGYTNLAYYRDYKALKKSGETEEYHKYKASLDEVPSEVIQNVYISRENQAKFHVNLKEEEYNLDDVQIRIWDTITGGWNTISSYKNSTTDNLWVQNGKTYYLETYTILQYGATGTVYQILTTDKSGNESSQYFRLYLDNAAPEVIPTVTVTKGSVNKIGDSTEYAYYSDSEKPMTITLNAADAGVGSIDNYFEYKVDDGEWTPVTGTSTELTFTTQSSVEKIVLKDRLGNETASTDIPKFVYSAGEKSADDITKLINYKGNIIAAPEMTKISVMTKGNNDYGNKKYKKDNDGKFIIISDEERKWIKLTFDTTDLDTIMGYIDSAYVSTANHYSLIDLTASDSIVKTTFEYKLPMAGTGDFNDVTKTYYAIDYAGNISSTGLAVRFTYNNPYEAQDVEFVPADSTIISGNEALKSALASAGITLIPTTVSENTISYNSGWILIRCTLYESGTSDYSENPARLDLYSGSFGSSAGGFSITDNTLKRINLGEKVSEDDPRTRYYCYLAFQIDSNQNDKKLYCTITGGESTCKKVPLYSSTAANMTWKQDKEGPAIKNSYYKTENSSGKGVYLGTNEKIKKVYNYSGVKGDGTAISGDFPRVKDSNIGKEYESILYTSGTKIYFPKTAITDEAGVSEYQLLTVEETPATPGDASFTKTPGDSWSSMVTDGDNYVFALPDITTPHTHIGLFLKDTLGNVSVYYLGNQQTSYHQWWIIDSGISADNITTSVSPSSYNAETGNYTVSVTIPAGTIVRSVGAENADVASVHFEDYRPVTGDNGVGQDCQPALNGTDGWINASTLTVTLNGMTPEWSEKDVKIKINGVAQSEKVFTLPVRVLAAGDFELGLPAATETAGQYTITATVPEEAKERINEDIIVKVNGTVSAAVTASWNTGRSVITLSGVPDPDWNEEQAISLTFKTTDGNVDKGVVKTIGKKTIDAEGFTMGTASLNTETGKYEVLVTFTDDTTPSTIINETGHVLKANGNAVTGANVIWDSTSNKLIISGMPSPVYNVSQNISLVINSRDGEIAKDDIVHVVTEKTAADVYDITVSELNPATWNNNITTVTFKVKVAAGVTGLNITSITVPDTVGNLNNYTGNCTLQAISNGRIPENVTITIKTNRGDVTWQLYGTNTAGTNGAGRSVLNRIFSSQSKVKSGVYDERSAETVKANGGIRFPFVAEKTAEYTPVNTVEKKVKTIAKTSKKKALVKSKDLIENMTETAITEVPEATTMAAAANVSRVVEAKAKVPTSTPASAERSEPIAVAAVNESLDLEVPEEKTSSPAVFIIMLAVLAGCAGALVTLKKSRK